MKRNETSRPLILSIVLGDEGERGEILVREKVRGVWVNSSLVTDPKTEIFLLFPINYLRFTIYYFLKTDTLIHVFCMYLFIIDSKHYLLINNSFIISFNH